MTLSHAFAGNKRFQAREVIGRGAMGVVYRAYDAEMGIDVALKTLEKLGPDQVYRLKQEFRSLASITHPNLVELHELVVANEACFFTMELVDGCGFLDYVRGPAAGEPLDCERLRDAIRQLVLGIAALHRAGGLHRDIKPSNIMVSSRERVVLLDFGLATALTPDPRPEPDGGLLTGTPAYMAPEQAWGRATPASDWYGLGVVLYEAVTGHMPFEGPPAEVLRRKQEGGARAPSTIVPGTPPWLDGLVRALLHPDPALRPGPEGILERLGVAEGTRAAGVAPFVGRAEETARLRRTLAKVAPGHPAIVYLEGASGIGKTELVARFLSTVESEGAAVVLRGRCHPQEVVPYRALDIVVDDLSRLLLSLGHHEVASLVPSQAWALVRLFPVLARVEALAAVEEPAEIVEPHEARRRGYLALRSLLAALARERPCVLWIDDVQWGDVDSASLLRELLRPPDPPALLVLLGYRAEDRDRSPLLQAFDEATSDFAREWIETIRLGPLPPDECRLLASALLGAAQARLEVDVDTMVEESGGSPFFVGEMARHILAEAARHGALVVPAGVQLADATWDRVRTLPRSARRVLELVSVAPGPIDRSTVLVAAGIGESGRPLISTLARQSLVRTTTIVDRVAIGPYHERIRESVVAQLPAAAVAAHHRALALALEASGDADADALARHFHGAGDLEKATRYAVEGAQRAASALAFLRAAELYRLALEWSPGTEESTRRLQVARGDALVNAGRSAEAARLFATAGAAAPRGDALELRGRAVEQFLAAGLIDEGVGVLHELARDLGLRYPATATAALRAIALRLAQLRLRGIAFRGRPAGEIPAEELTRIDLCYSVGKGLAMVDSIRGIYFDGEALFLALRAGDPVRIGRTLVPVATALRCLRNRAAIRWGDALLDTAQRIATDTGDVYGLGMAALARSQASLYMGGWRNAAADADEGIRILTNGCRGATLESNIARMSAMRALEELGRLQEVAARAEELLVTAEAVGDRYAEVTALLNLAFSAIADDDLRGARSRAHRAVERWTQQGFNLQHLYAMRVEAYADLYEGHAERAWRRVQDTWPALKSSYLARLPMIRMDAHILRARVALALGTERRETRTGLLRRCERDVRVVEREGRRDGTAHALLLRAGISARLGDQARSLELVERAALAYEQADMAVDAACALRRRGDLVGGEKGSEQVAAADRVLHGAGIRNAARWVTIHAPGFGA